MEIRSLKYFLEIANLKSMSRAADRLHLSQAALSKSMKDLEEETNAKLYIRKSHSLELTEAGRILKNRAEEILRLVEDTEAELHSVENRINGDIHIGTAETADLKKIMPVIKQIIEKEPGIHFHMYSGNSIEVTDKLSRGLYGFGILLESVDLEQYNCIPLPSDNLWGCIIPKNHMLSKKKFITPDDLIDLPIICSSQGLKADLPLILHSRMDELNIVGTFNLPYSGIKMLESEIGVFVGLKGIIDTSEHSQYVFIPFWPTLKSPMNFIWSKSRNYSEAEKMFLDEIRRNFETAKNVDS